MKENRIVEHSINKSQPQAAMHCFLFEPSVYISLLASIEGDITVEEMKAAVEKAYTQNETTMSKVILEGGNVFFQNISQTGCKVFVDERGWQEIMHESEQSAFKINEGELVRSYIIPEKEGYSLFIMAHHITADGKALMLMLEDILCNLAGKEVEYRALNREGAEKIPSDMKLAFFTNIAIKVLNTIWKKNGKIFTWEDYYNIHEKFWKFKQSDIQFEIINKEQLNCIKTECKELDITVNSYVVTKMLQEHLEYENVCCPISLRGASRSISNRVALVRFLYKYNTEKTFGDNAKEVHRIIRQHLEDSNNKFFIALTLAKIEPTLLDSTLMYAHGGYKNTISKNVAHLIGYAGDKTTHLSVTNLQNVLLKNDYDRFCLKNIAFTAACMSATKNVACVSTFQNTMTISYSNIKNRNPL